MKDIDFDELDRAVSSVLGQKPVSADEVPVTMPPVVSEPAQPAVLSPAVPVTSPVVTTPELDSAPQADPSPSLAVKRRGKFMDVMHPSADMNPTTAPSTPTVRQSRALAPLPSPSPEPETPQITEAVPPTEEESPEPTAAVDESKALIGAEPVAIDDEPLSSPADMTPSPVTVSEHDLPMVIEAGPHDTVEETPASIYVDPLSLSEPTAEIDESPHEQALDNALQPESPEPAEPAAAQITPFLTDTKVDKRPLGAFVESETPPGDGALVEGSVTPSELPEAPQPQATPLPRELQPDVVHAEADLVSDEEQPESVTDAGPFATKVPASAETTDDDRVEGHPLFDTSTYHEPIAAVASKATPAWVWWLGGLGVCLAVGAGVGYFLFTAGL